MPTSESPAGLRPVAELLTDYLLHSPGVHMPGSDGMLLVDVLASYEALAADGQVPTEAQLCQLHPDLAARLSAFFYLTHSSNETAGAHL